MVARQVCSYTRAKQVVMSLHALTGSLLLLCTICRGLSRFWRALCCLSGLRKTVASATIRPTVACQLENGVYGLIYLPFCAPSCTLVSGVLSDTQVITMGVCRTGSLNLLRQQGELILPQCSLAAAGLARFGLGKIGVTSQNRYAGNMPDMMQPT